MSDKPSRTISDVQNDYQAGCLRAGHIQYQIVTLQKDLDLINDNLRSLNIEAAGVAAPQAEVASV